MIGEPLGASKIEEALRAIRSLGAHRYVGGRLHLIHAFALDALRDTPGLPALADAVRWAGLVMCNDELDRTSRDDALWRRATDSELAETLEAFWMPGPRSTAAREKLRAILDAHDYRVPNHAPFDERAEDQVDPLLIDAGWELLPLSQLDTQRHAGGIAAFGGGLAFESARFEEETAVPPLRHLYELPAIGPVELLRGVLDTGDLAEPLVVWVEGNETYLDYVMRGVRRAAKLV